MTTLPNNKHIVKVDREKEKNLYRLLKGLELSNKNGKNSYEIKSSSDEWHSAMRSFGKRAKGLFDENIIGTPWLRINQQTKRIYERKIPIDTGIVINEKKGNKMSFFHFKRRTVF